MDTVRIHSLGADAPAASDAGGSWGTFGGRLRQPFDRKACRQRKAFRLQFMNHSRSFDGGQSRRSDIGRVNVRNDFILVVLRQAAGSVITEANDRYGWGIGLCDFHLMMNAL